MKTEIIRAYQLQFWDIFIKQGYYYKVIKKDETGIHYKSNNRHQGAATGTLGAKSQEKVELVIDAENIPNPPPQKIKAYDWETRKFIGAYKNAVIAGAELGVPDSHICDYINRIFKDPNYNLGYHFVRTRK
jgi:hypothetical protein